MSEFKGTYLENLLNKKAEENNSIDLNAYALGIKDSKAPEMLEMLKSFVNDFDNGLIEDFSIPRNRFEQLIKQATEL